MANNYLGDPHPELATLYAQFPRGPKTHTADGVSVTRQRSRDIFMPLVHAQQLSSVPEDNAYKVLNMDVPHESHRIPCRVYIPCGDGDRGFPLLLWAHGGGFVIGDLDMDDLFLKTVCVDLQIVVFHVDYRLAPEHPFPEGLNDVYAVLCWVWGADVVLELAQPEHAVKYQGDLSHGFIISGQSAGANFTAVLAHRVKNDPAFTGVKPTGQLLQIPSVLHAAAVPDTRYSARITSRDQCETAPVFTTHHQRDYYEILKAPPYDPDVSPLLFASLEGLPPAYMQVCGLDPMRDEALVYHERLQEAGVPCKLDIYPGTVHGFHLWYHNTNIGQQFDKDFRDGIRWLLSQGKS